MLDWPRQSLQQEKNRPCSISDFTSENIPGMTDEHIGTQKNFQNIANEAKPGALQQLVHRRGSSLLLVHDLASQQ